jgi:hypothetical protein
MASAFQSTAFQTNTRAFQIDVVAAAAPDPGSRIVGGHFSRGRWRDLKRQWSRERDEEKRAALRVEMAALQRVMASKLAKLAQEKRLAAEQEEAEAIAILLGGIKITPKLIEAIEDEDEEALLALLLH